MAQKPLSIDSILSGWSETYYLGSKGSFNCSLGIDPDYPIPGQTKSSGMIMPIGYEKFSGAGLTGYPKWILTNPKNNKTYVYSTINFLSYDSSLAVETVLATPTSGAGNGAEYYNDYIYLATPTDISRYGALSGTPSGGTLTNCTGLPYTGLANGTDGNLITWDADGAIAVVATGDSGQVLTSNGAGAAPTFQAAAGGGQTSKFSAKMSADQNITTGSGDVKLQFNSEIYDIDSEYDPTTNYRFTATSTGYYLLSLQVYVDAYASGNVINLSAKVNGTIVSTTAGQSNDSNLQTYFLNDIIYLTAEQYVEVYINQNGAGTAIVDKGGAVGTYTRWSMHRLS